MKKYQSFLEFNIPNWTTTSTNPELDINYEVEENSIDEQLVEKILKLLQSDFDKNFNIKKIKEKAHGEFGDNLYDLLELHSFFKGLTVKLKIDGKESAIRYFEDFMEDLSRIFLKINKDFSLYDVNDKFKKVRELKKPGRELRELSRVIFRKELPALIIEFLKMTEYVKKEGLRVLVTLDGRDSAGKGSFIRLIESFTDERIVNHKWFPVPNEHDQRSWFDRYERVLPKPGILRFFDRSWYNRAINDPVNGYCTEEQYMNFMHKVNPFEEKLIDDGIILIKLWFSIEKKTQELRFELRQASPIAYWKFSPNDAKQVDMFERFTFYKEQMFAKTSSKKSPWVVVDMNDKKLGQLNAIKYLLTTIPYENKADKKLIKPYKTRVYKV